MAKKILFGVIALAAVLFFSSGYLFNPSDEAQVKATLQEALSAAGEGKPSPVLESLSFRFDYGGEEPSRIDIAKVVRQAKPKLTALSVNPEIEGQTATVTTAIDAKLDYMGFSIDQTVPNVTIKFEKQVGTKWLVVPQPKWRIISVDSPNLPNP